MRYELEYFGKTKKPQHQTKDFQPKVPVQELLPACHDMKSSEARS
jgi:hypothetical protein